MGIELQNYPLAGDNLVSQAEVTMKKTTILTLLIVGALVVPTTVVAVTEGNPDLSVTASNNHVTPGETTELTVNVQNDGEIDQSDSATGSQSAMVTTASAVKVEMKEKNDDDKAPPIRVKTGRQSIGSVPSGQAVPATFKIVVDEDAEPGTYRVPVKVTYSYTEEISASQSGDLDYDRDEVRKTFHVTINVDDSARFEVQESSSDVAVGDSGTVSVTVENVGTEAASDASVQVQSQNSGLTFGSSQSPTNSASSYVGNWEPGESRTLTYDANVADGTTQRDIALSALVNYEDSDGTAKQSKSLSFGVTPNGEQTFAVENPRSTLRVGREGTLSGELVNTGSSTAKNAVVVFEPTSSNIDAVETEYAVGTLEAGERANFEFDAQVSESGEAGPRQFTYTVKYRNNDGESRQSDPLDVIGQVQPQQKEFTIDGVNTTFSTGESGQLEVTLTNNRDEAVSDVSAKLFVDSPISASDDEAFIDHLEPGESEKLTFGVSVGSGAIEKNYPVKMDFQYDTPDGDTIISDTYQVPVTVTAKQGGGLPLPIIGGVIVFVLLGVVGYIYTTRS